MVTKTAIRGVRLLTQMCAARGHGKSIEVGSQNVLAVDTHLHHTVKILAQKEFRCICCGGLYLTSGHERGGFN